MKIVIGSDKLGLELKKHLIGIIENKGIEIYDAGVEDNEEIDYPEIAKLVADKVNTNIYDRGILICGTGIGMAIAANKVKGIRAAVCHDIYSAERSRMSNNAQIMAMGALVVGKALSSKIVSAWLESEFQGGRSTQKVEKIMKIEEEYMSSSR